MHFGFEGAVPELQRPALTHAWSSDDTTVKKVKLLLIVNLPLPATMPMTAAVLLLRSLRIVGDVDSGPFWDPQFGR